MKNMNGPTWIVLIVVIAVLTPLGFWLWQLLWNTVIFGIFGLWRPLHMWEAALVWMLISMIAGRFRSVLK